MQLRALIFLALFFASLSSYAGEKTLYTDSETCSLREFGWAIKPDPVVIKSEYKRKENSACLVNIPKKDFYQKFKMCYLSGIEIDTGTGIYCKHTSDMYDNQITFEFGSHKGMSCYYTCVTK
jgi:hypothetical protein